MIEVGQTVNIEGGLYQVKEIIRDYSQEDEMFYKLVRIDTSECAPEEDLLGNIKGAGTKHDIGKARMHLIPPVTLLRLADVMGYGALKYSDHNFRKGIKWSRLLDALLRHALAISAGDHVDDESELPHYAHIMANAVMLGYHYEYSIGTNDIPVEGQK